MLTTIHAADFRDEKGDRLEGKNTLPISFPEASRIAMLISLVLWSTVLSFFWDVHVILASVLLVMGAMVGFRFVCQRDTAADRKSYTLYNVGSSWRRDVLAEMKCTDLAITRSHMFGGRPVSRSDDNELLTIDDIFVQF